MGTGDGTISVVTGGIWLSEVSMVTSVVWLEFVLSIVRGTEAGTGNDLMARNTWLHTPSPNVNSEPVSGNTNWVPFVSVKTKKYSRHGDEEDAWGISAK